MAANATPATSVHCIFGRGCGDSMERKGASRYANLLTVRTRECWHCMHSWLSNYMVSASLALHTATNATYL